ncbi:MAG: ABC transporter permease [Anaerolineae bacterium]|jgi:peptide/nickel transport system permease protein
MAEDTRLTVEEVPEEGPALQEEAERLFVASQWQLMWWRFRRHKLALVSVGVVVILYLIAIFVEFLATYDPYRHQTQWVFAPPQIPRLGTVDGRFGLYVLGLDLERDPVTLRPIYTANPERRYRIEFFVHGQEYKLLGLFPTDVHLFGLEEGSDGTMFLLGTDRLGRDMWSRIMYGTRISTSIGLVGVSLSFILGVIMGGFSGLYGGVFDTIVQRVIELLRSIPTVPLWLGLSAAIPKDWPQIRVYFAITIILSLVGWTGLARVVRGRFLSLREEDFVTAARVSGAGDRRIVFTHLVPSILSHIIASITLNIPGMILSETSLSFLGLGLRPPTISWGVLLQEAQNVRTVALAPWLMIPGLFVIVTVLCFNFMGDGLRDAADPYSR